MDRRAFLWMALATLAGTGCVSRTQSGFGTAEPGLPLTDADVAYSPGSSSEAKAIFKEFTSMTWGAPSPQHAEDAEESRWLSNAAAEVPGDSDAQSSAAPETGTASAYAAQTDRPAAKPAEKTAPSTPKQSDGRADAASGRKTSTKKENKTAVPPAALRARAGDVRRAVNGVIAIRPGEVLQFEAQGYCLDPDRPAPSEGEPMRFVPMAGLINFRLRRLFYKVLHMAGRQHAGYAADFQNVVWAIRTADAKQNSWGDELGSSEKRLLNTAMPGGAALLQQVRRTATGRPEGGRGLTPLVPGVNFSADSRVHLERLFRQTPPGAIPHSDAQFSMLSAEVAGRAENLGRLRVRWQIANSSNKDFAFDAAQWALDPQRKVQREALPPPSQGLVIKA